MDLEYNFYELSIWMALVSFLGFLSENCWLAITKGYMDNRNMNLPFLFGYGFAILFIYFFLGTPDHLRIAEMIHVDPGRRNCYLFYFFVSAFLVSVGEILLGTFVETFFGFEYWNYTRIPFHITKYTSLPTSAGFGVGITLLMGYCFEPVMSYIHNVPETAVKAAGIILLTVIIADFVVCFSVMYRNQSQNIQWVIKSPFHLLEV